MAQKIQPNQQSITLKINGEAPAIFQYPTTNIEFNESQSTRSKEKSPTLNMKQQQKYKFFDRRHTSLDNDIRQLDLDKERVQLIIPILQQHKKKIVISALQKYVEECGLLQQPSLSYGNQELNTNEVNGTLGYINENLQGQICQGTFPSIDSTSFSSLHGDLKTHTQDKIPSSSYGIQELNTNEGNGTLRLNSNENLLRQTTYPGTFPAINGSSFSSLKGNIKTHTQDNIQNIEERIKNSIDKLKLNFEELSEIVKSLPKVLAVEPTDLNHGVNSEVDGTQECYIQNDKVLELFKELMLRGEEYHKCIQTLAKKVDIQIGIATMRKKNEQLRHKDTQLADLREEVSQLRAIISKKPTERSNIEPKPPSSLRSPEQEAHQNRHRGHMPNSVYKRNLFSKVPKDGD
ncbi:uncharacterized protein LOC117116144 [Anneissia japonica]|uniref:uncharacterized protein LOC117116144 n=1 Tax=Anneissia japonica TaxID=1529436 RepID=UPI0014255718|nr:uncharacterized protein LOC117116144 [Anneissia japonica]XP_033116033.1 uncharacterized protein LOC117116144 [Anneissia japonica]